MNFIVIFLLTAALQIVAPWWVIALIPFLVHAWRPTTALPAFLTSFGAVAALWFGYGFYLHTNSEGAMSNKIAAIFGLPNGLLLLVVTAIIGGLVAGLSGLSGVHVRQMFSVPGQSVKRPVSGNYR